MNIKHAFINLTDPVIFQSFGGEAYWEKVDVSAGTSILEEGEQSQDFYYIFSGQVEVTKALSDGKSKHLALLSAGQFFGEGSLLSEQGRSASVHAKEDSVLLRLSHKHFEDLVQKDPQAGVGIVLGIVKVLNARLRETNERLMVLHRIAMLMGEHAGHSADVLPQVLRELHQRVPDFQLVLFGADGLPFLDTGNVEPDRLANAQVKIPDYAHRLQEPQAAGRFLDGDNQLYVLLEEEGQFKGVLYVYAQVVLQDEDVQFLLTIAEHLTLLF